MDEWMTEAIMMIAGEGTLVAALVYWVHITRQDLIWWRDHCTDPDDNDDDEIVD